MDIIKLYYRYIIIFIKSRMEYRFSFFMDLFIQVFTNTINCIVIWLLVYKFGNIGGWSFYELLLLYSFNLTSFGIGALFFWSPMYKMEDMIREGDFDKMLYKPINPFLYLVITQFDYIFIAHILLGSFFMIYAFVHLNFILTIGKLVTILILLLSAVMVQSAILIACGSVNFWYVKSGILIDTLVWSVRRFLEYPISIYNKLIQFILIFIIPYALVSYFPTVILMGKDGIKFNNGVFCLVIFCIASILFFCAYRLWVRGIRRYEGAGS